MAYISITLASIVSLLFWCRPTAVRWRIIAIIVDAIKHQPWRAAAHVSQKIFESIPAPANSNAASAVTMIGGVIGIETARAHRAPASIFGANFAIATICFAVTEMELAIYLLLKATARSSVVGFKIVGKRNDLVSAIALA